MLIRKYYCINSIKFSLHFILYVRNQITALSSQNTELMKNIEKLEKEKEKEAQEKADEVFNKTRIYKFTLSPIDWHQRIFNFNVGKTIVRSDK